MLRSLLEIFRAFSARLVNPMTPPPISKSWLYPWVSGGLPLDRDIIIYERFWEFRYQEIWIIGIDSK